MNKFWKTFIQFFLIGFLAGFCGTLSTLCPAAMPYLMIGGIIGVGLVWLFFVGRFVWKHRNDKVNYSDDW